MKVNISVPEAMHFFKKIQENQERLFEMIRLNVPEEVRQASRELTESVEQCRERDLSGEKVEHLFVDWGNGGRDQIGDWSADGRQEVGPVLERVP